jgi:hypothetical protein
MACTANIYVTKKVRPETSPTACKWPVQPIHVKKKVGPQNTRTACTCPLQAIYMMNLVQRLSVQHVHVFYTYILDGNVGPWTSPSASIWPLQPI